MHHQTKPLHEQPGHLQRPFNFSKSQYQVHTSIVTLNTTCSSDLFSLLLPHDKPRHSNTQNIRASFESPSPSPALQTQHYSTSHGTYTNFYSLHSALYLPVYLLPLSGFLIFILTLTLTPLPLHHSSSPLPVYLSPTPSTPSPLSLYPLNHPGIPFPLIHISNIMCMKNRTHTAIHSQMNPLNTIIVVAGVVDRVRYVGTRSTVEK